MKTQFYLSLIFVFFAFFLFTGCDALKTEEDSKVAKKEYTIFKEDGKFVAERFKAPQPARDTTFRKVLFHPNISEGENMAAVILGRKPFIKQNNVSSLNGFMLTQEEVTKKYAFNSIKNEVELIDSKSRELSKGFAWGIILTIISFILTFSWMIAIANSKGDGYTKKNGKLTLLMLCLFLSSFIFGVILSYHNDAILAINGEIIYGLLTVQFISLLSSGWVSLMFVNTIVKKSPFWYSLTYVIFSLFSFDESIIFSFSDLFWINLLTASTLCAIYLLRKSLKEALEFLFVFFWIFLTVIRMFGEFLWSKITGK